MAASRLTAPNCRVHVALAGTQPEYDPARHHLPTAWPAVQELLVGEVDLDDWWDDVPRALNH